ncbi:N-acetyltransferase- GNAT family [Apiospora aurea]|uniref:N-acetyltransferase- GNAT family n=1 Tax=Apiospora aurea TaxID=335848 RepID=A0ABR1Q8I8_9PEZI
MALAATPLNIAALGCIISGSCASGIGMSASLLTMPALIRPDVPQDALVHQWHNLYRRGAALMPVLAGATTLSYWLVAYYHTLPSPLELGAASSASGEWRGFAAAGALTLAIVPYTLVVMMPTIRTLEASMDGAAVVDEKGQRRATMSRGTAEALLRKWTQMNVVRSLIPLVGAACAVWNLLG